MKISRRKIIFQILLDVGIFLNSVRDFLLRNENLSNYRYTMATSYLTSIFQPQVHGLAGDMMKKLEKN